jgi:hypothetical protein
VIAARPGQRMIERKIIIVVWRRRIAASRGRASRG